MNSTSARMDYIYHRVEGTQSYVQELHDELAELRDEVAALRAETAHLRELLILSSRDKEA